MLKEDILSLTTIKESICLKDGHYEIAFPLSDDAPRLPSNRTLAEHRLKLLRKRLLKNPYLHLRCSSFMDCLLENEHARRVPMNRLELPVGVV